MLKTQHKISTKKESISPMVSQAQTQGTQTQVPPTLAARAGDLGTKLCAAQPPRLSDDNPTWGNLLLPLLFPLTRPYSSSNLLKQPA